jgi:mono/diheme cytochrome c family protein
MLRKYSSVLVFGVLFVLGCENAEDRAAREQAEHDAALQIARADSVAQAAAAWDPTAFDSIAWDDDAARLERGQVVWSFSCARCHGAGGAGDGEVAREHEVTMPTLLDPNWALAGNIEETRHTIFVGHVSEMPNWGLVGLKFRDLDAVAFFIHAGLRAGLDEQPEQ